MKKRIIILIGLIITILGAYISFSYALFEKTETQEGDNTITTYNCLDIEIEGNNELNLTNAFPIQDEEGVQTSPYVFKIKNKCDKYVSVDVGIELQNNNTFSDEKLKVTLNKKFEDPIGSLLSTHREYNTENDVQVLSNQYILLHDGINANSEANYEYRMWIDYSAGNEVVGTTFKGKIIATATIRTEEPHGWSNSEEGMLLYALKRDNEVTNSLTIPGQEINLPEESELSSAQDDYGTSYYFRGNVQNNYLIFANKCWRIVRITGDGSIKLLLHNNDEANCNIDDNTLNFAKYDGEHYKTSFNGEEETYTKSDGTTGYIYNTPSGLGFMYGNQEPIGSSDTEKYLDAQANLHDSTILKHLKQWYDLNGVFTYKEKSMLADVIWCGDKKLRLGNGYEGAVSFKSYERLIPLSKAKPSLICPDDSIIGYLSKYTANDNINGNGDLNGYKIGLLTSDEGGFAGGINSTNNSNLYLNARYRYFLISSRGVNLYNDTYFSYIWGIDENGGLGSLRANDDSYFLRPSIALISNVKITNINQKGTINNPYIIDET